MKYLLIAHYSAYYEDDYELVNNSWIVGEETTKDKAIKLAKEEIDNYIDEQVENEDLEDEEEIEDFRSAFNVSINDITSKGKMDTIASLCRDSDYYHEDLEIEVIKM